MIESLGQQILSATGMFLINNIFILILMVVTSVIGLDIYNRYFRINRNTDSIDLMTRYSKLQMCRRYTKRGSRENI